MAIAVTPANPSFALGTSQQLKATGTYTDGSVQSLTGSVTWASSNTSVATISSSGLATSLAQSTSEISATSGSVQGSTTLTVGSAVLVSIAVTPANPSIALGGTQQFTATGTYSDGSTQNLTSSATWASSSTTVATITSNTALAERPGHVLLPVGTVGLDRDSVVNVSQVLVTPQQAQGREYRSTFPFAGLSGYPIRYFEWESWRFSCATAEESACSFWAALVSRPIRFM